MVTLEVCCSTLADVKSAARGVAYRIELCQGLSTGGLTPTPAFIRAAKEILGDKTRLHVLIRPREGNFIYNEEEANVMLDEIASAKESGADGVVIGALTPANTIDRTLSKRLVDEAKRLGLSVTYSRAIDLCDDILSSAKEVAELGCDRILTSGGAPKAVDGLAMIKEMVQAVPASCSVMAASGVNLENCEQIVEATGVRDIHGSMRKKVATIPGINTLPGLESDNATTSTEQIEQVKAILSKY